jgi:hypothetical protein
MHKWLSATLLVACVAPLRSHPTTVLRAEGPMRDGTTLLNRCSPLERYPDLHPNSPGALEALVCLGQVTGIRDAELGASD